MSSLRIIEVNDKSYVRILQSHVGEKFTLTSNINEATVAGAHSLRQHLWRWPKSELVKVQMTTIVEKV